ncbi:MAG: RDD family protein [Planctomycetota bacterium]
MACGRGRLVILACSCGLMAGAGALPAASSEDHVWFIVRSDAPRARLELRHCARDAGCPYYTRGLTLAVNDPNAIEAMAAWRNQLWLVFAPTPGEPARRETFTVQVQRNPALEVWYHEPHDHLRAVVSLNGAGSLGGFVGTADGPVAMILDQGPPETGETAARLLQLRGRQWHEVPLPRGLGREDWRLGAAGPDGRNLLLLQEPEGRGGPVVVHRRDADGVWSAGEVPLAPVRLRSLSRVGPNVALVMETAPAGQVEVAYLRPGSLLRLAQLAPPQGRWSVLGARDGLRLIGQTPLGEVVMTRIDPISGDVGPREVMAPQSLMSGRVLHRPLFLALGITALMVIVLFRPTGSAATVALPESMAALPPLPRLLAVAADLGVSGVVSLILFRCPPVELLWWPLWTTDLWASAPFLVMVGLTVAHSTLTELAAACTLGKKLVGAKVVGGDGARPSAGAILVRNALKTIVLLIPVLAVFSILNPHLQGLGDQVARTVVVRQRTGGDDETPNDR